MNKFPHFQPDPYLWTRIEANILGANQRPNNPFIYWSMGFVVIALFAMSWVAPMADVPSSSQSFTSLNALYDE